MHISQSFFPTLTGCSVDKRPAGLKGLKRDSLRVFLLKLPVILMVYYLLMGLVIVSPIYQMIALPGDFQFFSLKASDCFPAGTNVRDVYFKAVDGSRLCGWLFKPSSPTASKDLILFSHGNALDMSDRVDYVQAFLAKGYPVFIYDYRGFGDSTGRASLDGILEDGLCAYKAAVDQLAYSPEHIVILGESIGTAVSCNIAGQRQAKSLVLLAPFISLPAVARSRALLSIYPEQIFPKPYLSNLDQMKKIKIPILAISGLQDTVIPHTQADALRASAAASMRLVKLANSGHRIPIAGTVDGDIAQRELLNFLK